jgi:glucokinase
MSAIGIDIGGTKSFAVRWSESGIEEESRVEHAAGLETVATIVEAIDRVADGTQAAIGVGVAGLVDTADRRFVWGPHVRGTGLAIGADIQERYDVPVIVDNDANTALYGELRLGVAQGYGNVLLVTLGTGIGGAIAIDGQVYRGGGFAGEWGHMKVMDGGLLCDCGKRGCWETVASGPALERLAREVVAANPSSSLAVSLDGAAPTGASVVAAADRGEETARALVAEVGRSFGLGLADLAAIFDPELIVVGGGLGSVGESILGPARRTLIDSLHGGSHRIAPTVHVAQLGPAAGAVGAALLAAEGGTHVL